jgi:hypothetical protein
MATIEEDGDFLGALKTAVRTSCAAIKTAHPGESLAGYALGTDDGLETLSYFAVTRESLAPTSTDPDLLFAPTDWPEVPEPQVFDEVERQLRSRAATARDFQTHVNHTFRLLVFALAEAKREGIFQDDVFLSVLSTDPSAHLEELENDSVRRLNTAVLVEARDAFLARWHHEDPDRS